MEAAKSSVKKFISRDGKHDTSIHERVAPSVQNETVNRTEHEEATTAVDREVHQDHYHTTEQPVFDKEVQAEQHHHNLLPTQERSFEHDDPSKVKERLATEASKYRDTHQKLEGEHTSSVAPSVAGEHVHHHVYETVQPVVQKETVEPHVVHTTQPIHEVHHNAAEHHNSTALPAVSMDEFKKQGGSLLGRDERRDQVEGCPPAQFDPHPHGESQPTAAVAPAVAPVPAPAPAPVAVPTSSSSSDEEKTRSKGDMLAGSEASAPAADHSHHHPKPASYGNDMHTDPHENSQSKPSFMDRLKGH